MAMGARHVCLWLCLLAGPLHAEGLRLNSTFESGIDVWAITPSQPEPPSSGFDFKQGSAYDDHDSLNLPDANTKWRYRTASPWMRYTGNWRLNANTEVNLKMRADQLMGLHVDVANMDWALSPYLGARVGVLNFNTNWCRTYDVDSPWIAEPDVFCRRNDFMNMNNAAPGLQIYANTLLGPYQTQALVGLYRPRLFSYETQEFGFNYRALRSNFVHNFNRKTSAAINFLHLQTGTQLRLGMMQSDQAGYYSPRLTELDRARHNLVNNYYVGFDTYVQTNLRLRYSVSKFVSRDFYDGLLVVQDRDKSEALELIYESRSSDLYALGWSRVGIFAAVDDSVMNNKFDDYFYHRQSSQFMSWRHQWGKGFHSILQWTHAAQTNGYLGNRRSGQGDAYGIRLGYQY
jgi:hypothetical protein